MLYFPFLPYVSMYVNLDPETLQWESVFSQMGNKYVVISFHDKQTNILSHSHNMKKLVFLVLCLQEVLLNH